MLPMLRRSAFVVMVSAAALAAQERRPLTHGDYDQWKSLRGTTYSPDGAWVAYLVEPQWGDGVLVVREAAGDRVWSQARGAGARFTADGRFVVFTRGKSKVEEREQKLEQLRQQAKGPGRPAEGGAGEGEPAPEGAPRAERGRGSASGGGAAGARAGAGRRGAGGAAAAGDGDEADTSARGDVVVLELATGAIENVGRAKGWTAPAESPFLLVHLERPEPRSAIPAGAPSAASAEAKPEGGELAAGAATEPEPAGETASRRGGRRAPADPLEQKRPEGSELRVRDLTTGAETSIADVVAYGLSRQGKWLWYHTSAKKPAQATSYGLFVRPLAGGEPIQLLDGVARVANVTIDRAEQCLAFTSDKEDFAADKPASDLYLWEGGPGPARRIAWAGGPGMPAGKRVAGSVAFCRDGSALSFAIHDAPAADPLPILPEDKVALDLWHWRDGQLQTVQQKRAAAERNPEWTASWRRAEQRLLVLGDDRLRTLRFLGPDGRHLVGSDGRAYEREVAWDGRYADVWLVDGASGARTQVLERLRGNVQNSPGGRYLIWFGPDSRWWTLDVATGERRDLTGQLGVPFHRHDDDHPEPDAAYGLAGWTEDDDAVLLYDEFDVWQVSPATGAALCVTDGFGRQQRLRLRLQPLPREDDRPWLDRELLLAATDVDTMAEGFFADALGRQQKPQRLVLEDANFGDVTRPRRSDRLFFTRGTFAVFPDLWTAAADFSGQRRLSDANPQQRDYRWGRAELVRWVDGDGRRRQGVLVKPDDFDPTRRYPMMVYFYERMTPGLHNHVPPAPGTSPNASYYVSNGYLWFMPDVVYDIGYPGASCVKCVVSGVQHLIAQGFVDERAIGAAGHSWGGYQTAFLVTRTNIFAAVECGAPVSNMLSAYGGIRYESGMSRQFQYEMTQSRIGGTPWQYPLRYQENSPIWFADRVQTPVLILHNDQDGAVPWTQGIEWFTALRRLGKESYLFNYNGEGHGLRQRQNQKDWTRRMAEYFAHHLKGEPAPKWMRDGVPFHERDAEKLPFAASYIDAHGKPAAARAAAAAAPAPTAVGVEAVGDNARSSAAPARAERAPAAVPLHAGRPAPAFDVADESGARHQLEDYRGRWLLLWFYPRANTPGCTAQGCGLRDRFGEFEAAGVAVLGVSVDGPDANAAFRGQHDLPFPLLCDVDRAMAVAYGAAADAGARTARRIAVLIDGDGIVRRVFARVDPATFAGDALAALPL